MFLFTDFKAWDLSLLLHLGAVKFWFSNELALKAWLMSLQKLGDCGSRGASVVPRVGMVSESDAACAWLPSPPDLAALECPRRPPCVPWRSVLVGTFFLWESFPRGTVKPMPAWKSATWIHWHSVSTAGFTKTVFSSVSLTGSISSVRWQGIDQCGK